MMTTETAKISGDVAVRYSSRPDIGRDYLEIDLPEGWGTLRKIVNKVLEFHGRKFTFTGWNSDRNVAMWCAPCNGSQQTARIL